MVSYKNMYRIWTWVQVLADTDAWIFCGIGGISDTSIGIWTTLEKGVHILS